MNTLVKNVLAAFAFIFAIGAAFASTTSRISSTEPADGFDGFVCIDGVVSAICTLTPNNNAICTLIVGTTRTDFNAKEDGTPNCQQAKPYHRPN